ncbi:MAG TPA: P-II family nitrogen regulator, partial [Thermoguttaceae bacterium]|nr:P-II family nitrogen regulator [Thermoguttaceae bacterium]
MKQIIAIVQPFMAEKVLKSLPEASWEALSVREVRGYGRQKSYLDEYRGSEYAAAFLSKVMIMVWVEDEEVEKVVRTIVRTARTGRQGDGKIFVLPAQGLAVLSTDTQHESKPFCQEEPGPKDADVSIYP